METFLRKGFQVGPVGRWLGSQPILSIWLNAIKDWQTLLRQGKELVFAEFRGNFDYVPRVRTPITE